MTFELSDLAERAISSKGWKWKAGMKVIGPDRLRWFRLEEDRRSLFGDWKGSIPDLSDSATVGCIFSLVREIWGPHASTLASSFEDSERVWTLHLGIIDHDFYGHEVANGCSEIEVLIKGLCLQPSDLKFEEGL